MIEHTDDGFMKLDTGKIRMVKEKTTPTTTTTTATRSKTKQGPYIPVQNISCVQYISPGRQSKFHTESSSSGAFKTGCVPHPAEMKFHGIGSH